MWFQHHVRRPPAVDYVCIVVSDRVVVFSFSPIYRWVIPSKTLCFLTCRRFRSTNVFFFSVDRIHEPNPVRLDARTIYSDFSSVSYFRPNLILNPTLQNVLFENYVGKKNKKSRSSRDFLIRGKSHEIYNRARNNRVTNPGWHTRQWPGIFDMPSSYRLYLDLKPCVVVVYKRT